MKNKVLDELCGRQQCKFKIIDDQVIILPLKIPILMNKVYQISQHLIFFFRSFWLFCLLSVPQFFISNRVFSVFKIWPDSPTLLKWI